MTILHYYRPVITVQVRILKDKLQVSNTPGLKQIMEKFIAFGFKTLLVFPGKQHIDFTPTPIPGKQVNQTTDHLYCRTRVGGAERVWFISRSSYCES